MNEIIIKNMSDPAAIELSQGLLNARAAALTSAKLIEKIETAKDLEAASHALGELNALEKTITAAHKDAKEPFLKITKRLDALKREYAESLASEKTRLSRMIGAHQEAERRKLEEARKAAEEEKRRIEFEARERERERILQEKKAFEQGGAPTGTLSADLNAIREEAHEQTLDAELRAAQGLAVAPSGSGVSVRKKWEFEVKDIRALYAARPELVKLEPNKAAIKAILAATNGAPIPGVESWAVTVAGVKAQAKSLVEIEDCDY